VTHIPLTGFDRLDYAPSWRLQGFCQDEFPASRFECSTETAGYIRKGSTVRQPLAPKEG
jgi:hypothetical protein